MTSRDICCSLEPLGYRALGLRLLWRSRTASIHGESVRDRPMLRTMFEWNIGLYPLVSSNNIKHGWKILEINSLYTWRFEYQWVAHGSTLCALFALQSHVSLTVWQIHTVTCTSWPHISSSKIAPSPGNRGPGRSPWRNCLMASYRNISWNMSRSFYMFTCVHCFSIIT